MPYNICVHHSGDSVNSFADSSVQDMVIALAGDLTGPFTASEYKHAADLMQRIVTKMMRAEVADRHAAAIVEFVRKAPVGASIAFGDITDLLVFAKFTPTKTTLR